MQRVLGIYEPIKPALVKGSIRHRTYEFINKHEERIIRNIKEEPSLDQLKDLYKNNFQIFLRKAVIENKGKLKQFNLSTSLAFKQIWPFFEDEAKLRAMNLHSFILKNNVLGDELWEKLTPKIKSEIRIESPKLGLKGIVDQIEIYENGFVPIELKTGKSPKEGVWPGHRIQLAAYAMLLEEKYQKETKEGFVSYLDIQERRHIAMNSFLRKEVIDLIKDVKNLLNSKNIPDFCTNENKCNVCGLNEDCHNGRFIQQKIKKTTTGK